MKSFSPLRRHLVAEVAKHRKRLRSGLAMRFDRAWWDGVPLELGDGSFEYEDWVGSPRRKFHYGLRKTISKFRAARAHLAEFDALRGAA